MEVRVQTLTLLFDPSPSTGTTGRDPVLQRDGGERESEEYRKVLELEKEIRSRDSGLRIVKRPWMGSDPD